MEQFTAHFDGTNICPDEPVSLPKDVPLRVTAQPVAVPPSPARDNSADVFDKLEAELGLVDGPADWAAEHDHYLYGSPKKSNGNNE